MRVKSIEQIARLAGVSKTTVSLVINGKHKQHRISPATVERVMTVVNRQGFSPNRYAQGLRLRSTRTIGLVVGDVTNWYFSLVEKSIEESAREKGYDLIIASSADNPERETRVIEALFAKSVDGLIVASVHPDTRLHEKSNRGKTPMVYVDRCIKGAKVCVQSDNRAATRQLIAHWPKSGCQAPVFIGGNRQFATHNERLVGFGEAVKKQGIVPGASTVLEGNFKAESGYRCMENVLGRKILPDAVFTASFTLLSGALRCLKERGVSRPSFRLGTFDNHPLLDFLSLPVDSIAQDCESIGREAFSLLEKQMEGKTAGHGIVKSTIIFRNPEE